MRPQRTLRFPRPRGAAALLLLAACLFAARAAGQAGPLQLPQPTGYVNDFANVIDPAYRDSMQAIIDQVREKSGGEIVVVTLNSLQGRSEDEVALQIGREWKVGRKGGPTDRDRNTGAVVLVSMDHRWKIEVGTNTSGFIAAAEAGRIGRDLMVPELRAGNVGRGIYRAVQGIGQQYAQHYGFQLTTPVVQAPPTQAPYQPNPYGPRDADPGLPIWAIIAIFALIFLFSRGRGCGPLGCLPLFIGGGGRGGGFGGGGWGGGGFGGGGGGGGFGGFGGGGGFSGGGSGGSW